MRVRQFFVLPKLPERLLPLQELAQNLWYAWSWDLVKLFIRLDAEMWEQCYQNPVEMLSRLPQDALQRAADDDAFVAALHRVYDKYQDYLKAKKWFHYKYGQYEGERIAYFSLEYGLDTSLPVYSGGLGVLSGDTLKSASDIGLPMTAVALLYRYGYFRQFLSSDGWQQERYEENDWYHMPVELVKDANGQPLRITVQMAGAPVHVQVWKTTVGLIPMYALDTNIPENSTKNREITSVLYGGDKDMRIRQEILLGIGGVRALRALGIEPAIFHMNEGHSWFLALERLRILMQEQGLSYNEALQYVWATTVFTTHTPVPAGNEQFDPVLVHRYLGDFLASLGVPWKDFLTLGRVMPEDESEPFGMTVAALKTSAFANGVSKLHGRVSREMWHNIWPGLPIEEVPIKAITNGVHTQSWISHDMDELYESYLGPRYRERPGAPEVWKRVQKIPDMELWRTHNRRRERLIFFARKRLKQQLQRRGASQLYIQRAEQLLDPQALTICFARRFSTYKRGSLIFADLARLERLVNDEKRPVQLIFSGKAHPLDNPGKEIIKYIVGVISEERFRNRIIFLEDYDINVARYMVQGADVWLNNPRRPQEASGTSGMKAALNGALHVSVLDGWWAEGYSDERGFKIGNGEEYENVEIQDRLEAEMLYDVLEREVVPLFHNRNGVGLPEKWIQKMKAAVQMAGEEFAAQGMLRNYTDEFYVRAIHSARQLRDNNFAKTRSLTAWLDRMRAGWGTLAINDVRIPDVGATVYVGQKLPIEADVFLGAITPDDVSVELVAGRLNSQEQLVNYRSVPAKLVKPVDGGGTYTFAAEVECTESGRFGIKARIIPRNDALPHVFKPRLISWW
ncbi:MAG TPA: alpha-glucan family phosphorylase [candidate division Zixibacteria bacterium]|nr:alpha-glucan family phosphorylase [candidate division Zixibacteria bacterium]MDD4918869.1 alpha-glucan family phosphorylase [candidate division Zixibacteria bacterium]MDM7973887.1 alpha-glucan family phosphorylase [candidate division Zixibacteria bacterium]HPM35993.1 alpha-glucan family phosphorylase [candidate division Zixibacteria bacterium]